MGLHDRPKVKARKIITPFSADDFDTTLTRTSVASVCENWVNAMLELSIAVTSTPTDLLIDILFSDDGVTYYKYNMGIFGDLRFVTAGCPYLQAFEFPINASYMKVRGTATGTDGSKKFTLTAKIILTA